MEINMDDVKVNIESLDVLKSEQDLQDETRMWDIYDKLQTISALITDLPVFPSLVWVWTWDIVVDKYKNHLENVDDEYVIKPGLEMHDIFKMFWEDADKNGFTLEYGTEDLDEHIWDWMIDRDIVIPVEDLEEEEDEDQ
jgi:hypothetical protein